MPFYEELYYLLRTLVKTVNILFSKGVGSAVERVDDRSVVVASFPSGNVQISDSVPPKYNFPIKLGMLQFYGYSPLLR